jgi:exopolyphosphatase/guanosine-5'-triphosphate,3'-diphosphate pyrophosphatase
MTSQIKIPTGRMVAFLDIGTNSIRLLMVRINPNQSYTILSQQKEVIRLGEGEFVHNLLQPEAMERAVLVCREFAEMARSYGAEEIMAVATSAAREAKNQRDFLRRLQRSAQIDVRLVSGREEARLIYLGVSSGVHLGDKKALFIDIGGGSTEVIIGDQEQYYVLDSLKLGAIRLTSLFFLPNESEPVAPARYALIQQFVRNAAVRTIQRVGDQQIDLAIGSSGTIQNLADISIYAANKRSRQRDDLLVYQQLQETVKTLCALPLQERKKIPGINPDRADIIIAGAAILDTLMQALGIKELRISERGLREGLLVDYLSTSEHSQIVLGKTVRERSVLQLGRACGFDEPHARHVADLAMELFDSAREVHLHQFNQQDRELCEYAALLHDVGTFLSYSNHQAHSYYLIRNSDLLGFDQTEIAIMANIGLFHRKWFPRRKKYPEFAALNKRSRRLVRQFSVLLRIAESLDRSHTGVVQHANLHKKDPKSILLKIQAAQEPQLEIWGVQNHRKTFRKAFGKKLAIEAEIASMEVKEV